MVRNVKLKTEPSGNGSRRRGSGLECRAIRSRYNAVKNLITEDRDAISRVGSDKFNYIINEVESLHEHVHKPKQQVADAEGLLDITNTLVTFIKAHNNGGVTPSDFVNCLIRDFGQQSGASRITKYEAISSIRWKDIGLAVSPVFKSCRGCRTMIGPMNLKLKQRKTVDRKKHRKPVERRTRPKELDDESVTKEKTDTDKIMAIMFGILKKNRKIRLENLVLNRNSFAQTVENLFALSFLVKDGRVQITVDDKGCHLVSPRNAPGATAVFSGEASFSHFVFRFDFRDWKLMMDSVGVGGEKMPHRNPDDVSECNSEPDSPSSEETNPPFEPTKLVLKFSGNQWACFPRSENQTSAGLKTKGSTRRAARI
ncbi:hypothetical protein LguiB_033564 [Lonicera macranthoides]